MEEHVRHGQQPRDDIEKAQNPGEGTAASSQQRFDERDQECNGADHDGGRYQPVGKIRPQEVGSPPIRDIGRQRAEQAGSG